VSYDPDVGEVRFPDEPRVRRVLGVYDALQRRDWPALQGEVAPVAVVRIEGESRYAGVYQGVGQLIALAVQFEERVIPFQSTIDALDLDGDEVRSLVTVSMRVPPDGLFRARLVETFSFDGDGKVSGLVVSGEDQAALDEYLG